jgi:hypothetical protein
MTDLPVGCAFFSLSPFLRGEGWGEGLLPQRDSRRIPLTRIASEDAIRPLPQAGRGEQIQDRSRSHQVSKTPHFGFCLCAAEIVERARRLRRSAELAREGAADLRHAEHRLRLDIAVIG